VIVFAVVGADISAAFFDVNKVSVAGAFVLLIVSYAVFCVSFFLIRSVFCLLSFVCCLV
jgi:hypothetical protein